MQHPFFSMYDRTLAFSYPVVVASIAAAANSTVNLNIDAGSDFLWQATTYMADIADAAQTASSRVVPLITMQITDTGSSNQLFNQDVPITCVAGTGELPFILPTSQILIRNSTLRFVFTNYDAASTYGFTLNLIGVKGFNRVMR